MCNGWDDTNCGQERPKVVEIVRYLPTTVGAGGCHGTLKLRDLDLERADGLGSATCLALVLGSVPLRRFAHLVQVSS